MMDMAAVDQLEPTYNPREAFKKFMPRSEKKKNKKLMLDELQDFVYNPRRFFC